MKASIAKRFIMLILAFAFIPMVGFSQTDDQKELAKKASLTLTESMTDALKLTDAQIDSVAACNLTYALSIFTTDPLTESIKKVFRSTLDTSLEKILDDGQYKIWTEKQKGWLDEVEKSLPIKDEEIDIIEETEDIDIF